MSWKLTLRGLRPSFALILLVSSTESEASPPPPPEDGGGGAEDCVAGEEALREGGAGAALPWKSGTENIDLDQLYTKTAEWI